MMQWRLSAYSSKRVTSTSRARGGQAVVLIEARCMHTFKAETSLNDRIRQAGASYPELLSTMGGYDVYSEVVKPDVRNCVCVP